MARSSRSSAAIASSIAVCRSPGSPPAAGDAGDFKVSTYPMRRRIPTVNVAVAMTVPTIQRTSLVSRFAIRS